MTNCIRGFNDLLMDRYHYLTLMNNIQDPDQYARDFSDLAADFESADCPNMAACCRTRAAYYGAPIALNVPLTLENA
jgi:hypothetical protein